MSLSKIGTWIFLLLAIVFVAGCLGQQQTEGEKTVVPEQEAPMAEVPGDSMMEKEGDMMREPEIMMGPAVVIELIEIPTSGKVGENIMVSWRVTGADLKAIHTAVHYGYEARMGTFDLSVGPAAAGYASLTTEFASGDFPLPKDFVGVLKADKAGTLYFRAHAIVDGKNYWTEEKVIVVGAAPSVEIITIPDKVSMGDTFQVKWSVKGTDAKATHTAVHYGVDSKPGVFGLDIGPAGAGYPTLSMEYASGEFAVPGEFQTTVKADAAGAIYIRAHAIVDGKNYWTEEKKIEVLRGPGVEMVSLPAKAIVGTDLTITWRVFGDGLRATHTSVHYAYSSKTGTFDIQMTPASSGYTYLIPDYASGDYALTRDFTASFKPPSAGILYLRGHAIIDGKNYWTEEKVVTVERISSAGGSGGSMGGGGSSGGY